jgi:hypothetical protein
VEEHDEHPETAAHCRASWSESGQTQVDRRRVLPEVRNGEIRKLAAQVSSQEAHKGQLDDIAKKVDNLRHAVAFHFEQGKKKPT